MQGDDLESEIKISGSLSYIRLMSSSNDLNCKGRSQALMLQGLQNAEMYPECVIASWDALILLMDAENIA